MRIRAILATLIGGGLLIGCGVNDRGGGRLPPQRGATGEVIYPERDPAAGERRAADMQPPNGARTPIAPAQPHPDGPGTLPTGVAPPPPAIEPDEEPAPELAPREIERGPGMTAPAEPRAPRAPAEPAAPGAPGEQPMDPAVPPQQVDPAAEPVRPDAGATLPHVVPADPPPVPEADPARAPADQPAPGQVEPGQPGGNGAASQQQTQPGAPVGQHPPQAGEHPEQVVQPQQDATEEREPRPAERQIQERQQERPVQPQDLRDDADAGAETEPAAQPADRPAGQQRQAQ